MTSSLKIILEAGPAHDVLLFLGEKKLFATPQISYIMQSPLTLSEEGAAIILDASYWWFDAGREPEVIRIERKHNRLEFVGRKRFEQCYGDSIHKLGECEFENWLVAVQKLSLISTNDKK